MGRRDWFPAFGFPSFWVERLNATWIQRTLWSRHFWAVLSGLALAASFPKLGIAGLAWVAPGCLLFSALGRSGGETFRIGFSGGLAYALAALSWLLYIPFPPGAISGWVALSAYVGFYLACWVWLSWKLFDSWGRAVPEPPAPETAAGWGNGKPLAAFFQTPLPRRILWALACAVLWVGLEMLLARLFTGFPWNLLGVSQHRILPVIQIAAVTGVHGVSFLVVWFSVALVISVLRMVLHPTQTKAWVLDLMVPLVALLAVLAWGSAQLGSQPLANRSVKAVLVQPSIPQTLIWDPSQSAARFEQLVRLSERALQSTPGAQLLIWPEAAVPQMLRYHAEIYRAVTNLAGAHGVWIILGSDDAEPRPGGTEREFSYFNSSFLVTPRGDIAGAYKKRRLVIFGEYVPLERWLPFMKKLTPIGGSFTAGTGAMPFRIPELNLKLSVLICFEDTFPHGAAGDVHDDVDFLLNLTNNGWFGESAAQWQHAANAVFRAVENRIPLVRCANNGLTCWVDPRGVMHDVYFPGTRDIYGAGFKGVDVPVLDAGERRRLTFYTRHGDWFGWLCAGLALGLTIRPSLTWAQRKFRR